MGRFLLTFLLGLALFAAVVWHFELWPFEEISEGGSKVGKTNPSEIDLGELLYPARPMPLEPRTPAAPPRDWIVVAGHFTNPDIVEVPSRIDGILLFVGDEIPEGTSAVAGVAPLLGEPFLYKEIVQGEQNLVTFYRPLDEESTVSAQRVIAKIDPAKVLNEVAIRKAKVQASKAEYESSIKLFQEAQARLERAERLRGSGGKIISEEEYQEKRLSRDKSEQDMYAKKEAVKVTTKEQYAAEIDLKEHTIRNELPFRFSKIKTIYHKGEEAVKKLEPVLQMYSTERLRAEGMVDIPDHKVLKAGLPVMLEPAVEIAPRVLVAHKREINGVAVTKDAAKPRVISASEDKTICIWEPDNPSPLGMLHHPDAVRAIACSPPGSTGNLLVAGCANGDIYLWDLTKLEGAPEKMREASRDALKMNRGHAEGVTALAFSPQGTWFASGGADHQILLWKTGESTPLYPLDSRHGVTNTPDGTITSLSFTPQSRLVEASTDNAIRIFTLHTKGARLEREPIQDRSGNVARLGVSQDGRRMIFDQGRRLQILSIPDGIPVGVLQNPDDVTAFETLALFSPDGSLMLTAGAPEGRLQLWKTPSRQERGYELRQLVTREKSPVTCAAFFPDAGLAQKIGSYAVSGTKDGNVYLWSMPSHEDVVNYRLPARLTMLAGAVDAGTRQLRIGVEVPNGENRFLPGRPVTIVIER